MTEDGACRCGHSRYDHVGVQGQGRCERFTGDVEDPFVSGAKWTYCTCRAFDDSRLPDPGERLEFGVHRMPSVESETAEAWPPHATWASRVRAATTRKMKRA